MDPARAFAAFLHSNVWGTAATEIVACLAEGDDTHPLAARLHPSEHTFQDYLKSAFAKTAVNSRRELVARARGA